MGFDLNRVIASCQSSCQLRGYTPRRLNWCVFKAQARSQGFGGQDASYWRDELATSEGRARHWDNSHHLYKGLIVEEESFLGKAWGTVTGVVKGGATGLITGGVGGAIAGGTTGAVTSLLGGGSAKAPLTYPAKELPVKTAGCSMAIATATFKGNLHPKFYVFRDKVLPSMGLNWLKPVYYKTSPIWVWITEKLHLHRFNRVWLNLVCKNDLYKSKRR